MNRFFIIGNPRSGTTLLRLMLNRHKSISVPPEAGFLVWLHKEFSDFKFTEENLSVFVGALKNTKKIENWNLDFQTLEGHIRERKPDDFAALMNEIYAYYSKVQLNKNVELYGDKNNYYLNKIDVLHKLYPTAKFLHIIRDGRSVAVSYKELMQKAIDSKYAPNLPADIENIANEWVSNIRTIEASFEKIDPILHQTVRFEDLVAEPEQSLRLICEFFEVDFDNAMLKYYETTHSGGLEPDEYMQWKSKNKMPLQTEEIEKYKKLDKQEILIFNDIARKVLEKYKFPVKI